MESNLDLFNGAKIHAFRVHSHYFVIYDTHFLVHKIHIFCLYCVSDINVPSKETINMSLCRLYSIQKRMKTKIPLQTFDKSLSLMDQPQPFASPNHQAGHQNLGGQNYILLFQLNSIIFTIITFLFHCVRNTTLNECLLHRIFFIDVTLMI